jgi:dUTP pyrophosphatase
MNNLTQVQIKFIDKELYGVKNEKGEIVGYTPPAYATLGSAAVDLRSAGELTLGPGQCGKVSTGMAISIINDDVAAVISPRSGLGSRGLVLGNLSGLIDSDYQGELMVILWNRSQTDTFSVVRGDRVAQMMFIPVLRASWEAVEEFTVATERGTGGFGSTGVAG